MRILMAVLPFIALAYVVWRSWRIVPFPLWGKLLMAAVMTLLLALGPVCMLPGSIDRLPLPVASWIYKASLSWIFILLYLLMLYILTDVLAVFHIVPPSLRHNSIAGSLAVAGVILALFAGGNIRYHLKHREAIDIASPSAPQKPLRIVMLSDLHLGYHIRRAEFARWVDQINKENPDLVLIAGDIIDRSVEPLLKEGSAKEFRRLKAPVFACPGNHEYYSGIDKSQEYYHLAGITMLRDSTASLMGLNIIGRDDRTNLRRKSLTDLLRPMTRDNFTIVLDHQPYNLDKAQHEDVDFVFCGHTHHGQVWPISWITDAIYEDAYGPLQKRSGKNAEHVTNYYVSSGMGIWGGKFRIGTRSEYIVLTLHR